MAGTIAETDTIVFTVSYSDEPHIPNYINNQSNINEFSDDEFSDDDFSDDEFSDDESSIISENPPSLNNESFDFLDEDEDDQNNIIDMDKSNHDDSIINDDVDEDNFYLLDNFEEHQQYIRQRAYNLAYSNGYNNYLRDNNNYRDKT
jgi:hypothetical protein